MKMIPVYQTTKSAACDLEASETLVIPAGEWRVVGTGMRVNDLGTLAEGECALVLPRSGLAAKFGVTVLNSPGLIDADYMGEIKVVLMNHSKEPFLITAGGRIAQLMVINHSHFSNVVTQMRERGDGGFGSTGV